MISCLVHLCPIQLSSESSLVLDGCQLKNRTDHRSLIKDFRLYFGGTGRKPPGISAVSCAVSAPAASTNRHGTHCRLSRPQLCRHPCRSEQRNRHVHTAEGIRSACGSRVCIRKHPSRQLHQEWVLQQSLCVRPRLRIPARVHCHSTLKSAWRCACCAWLDTMTQTARSTIPG